MEDVVSTFPLLRLPIDAILYTFRAMHPEQIFGMSLLSKRTKNLVESLKITAGIFQVAVSDAFEIDLYFLPHYSGFHFKLYHVRENQPPQELGTPGNIHIQSSITNVTWSNSKSVKELLDHLEFIFHSPITTLYFQENWERFSFESVHKNVKGFKRIYIAFIPSGNHEYNKKVLSLFKPASITLVGRPLVDLSIPKDTLIQNFNVVHVSNIQITLD